MHDLKTCPFCGGSAWCGDNVYELDNGYVTLYFVECNGCHATTFEYDTEEEAAYAWNRRYEDGN